jgi:hypothetical protein
MATLVQFVETFLKFNVNVPDDPAGQELGSVGFALAVEVYSFLHGAALAI